MPEVEAQTPNPELPNPKPRTPNPKPFHTWTSWMPAPHCARDPQAPNPKSSLFCSKSRVFVEAFEYLLPGPASAACGFRRHELPLAVWLFFLLLYHQCMYINIHIYIYIHSIYIKQGTYVCMYMYIYKYINVYVYVYVYLHVDILS